jgi:hypothetical protein
MAGLARLFRSGSVQLVQQVPEPVRDALADDVVINPLQDIAEPPLVFAAQASSLFAHLSIGMHCRLWPQGLIFRQVLLDWFSS